MYRLKSVSLFDFPLLFLLWDCKKPHNHIFLVRHIVAAVGMLSWPFMIGRPQ